jgi:hypothetical protein
MSDFINIKGIITDVEAKQSKTGTRYWKICFRGEDERLLSGTTFDDPNDPKCQGQVDVGYIETQNGKYNNITFCLPNHVPKGQQRSSNYNPYAKDGIQTDKTEEMKAFIIKAIADHEAKHHRGMQI